MRAASLLDRELDEQPAALARLLESEIDHARQLAAASPLVAVVPGQLAAERLAQRRGLDVDHPFGLQKVTLTR